MSDAVEVLRASFIAAAPVTNLVPEARQEPLKRTQALGVPAITFQTASNVPFTHLGGDAGLDANLVDAVIYADDYTQALAIARACRDAGFAAGHILQLQLDGYDPETDPELYRITQTWSVFT